MEAPFAGDAGGSPAAAAASVLSYGGHRQALFGIVSDLKRLQEIAAGEGAGQLAATIREVLQHAEQQGFSVAVVGEFKRGKSTFINALLGREILPADIVPTSATINRVTYGLKPAARIIFRENGAQAEHFQDISIDQLAAYVTKLTPEAEAIAAQVKEAVVSYPVLFCKNNVDIIDTPGLSDDEAMTRVTLGILPRVDAAIMVILATAPFSISEGEFLDTLLHEHGLGSVLFVVTALDRIRKPEDRERILAGIAARIEERIVAQGKERYGEETEIYRQYLKRVGKPRVFGISGYEALQAKAARDPERLAASHFPELEAALERFLTEETGVVVLKTQAERISRFSKEILQLLDAQMERLVAHPGAAAESSEILSALLDAVQRMSRDELRALDGAAARAKESGRQELLTFAGALKGAADNAVVDAALNAGHLEPAVIEGSKAGLRKRVSKAVEEAGRAVAARLHSKMKNDAAADGKRLLSFAAATDRILAHVRRELSASLPQDESPAGSLVIRLGGRTGFAGAAGSEACVFGPAALSDLVQKLALPPDWAAALDVKVAAELPGGWLTRKISDIYRVETFKKGYRAALVKEIDAQVLKHQMTLAQRLDEHVTLAFEALKQEVEISLQEVRSLLVELRAHQERAEVIAEREQRRIDQLRAEARRIRDSAWSLAVQLNRIGE